MAILDLKGDVVKHVIGTDVQAWDAQLDDIAALDVTQNDNFIVSDGSNWTQETTTQVRTTLGLGTIALINDAPSDGTIYGRRNAAWVDASGSGTFVEIAGDTMTGPLVIDGSTDAVQLTVQANGTQTNPLILLESSAGAELIRIDSDEERNTFIGHEAGKVNAVSGADGIENTFIGYEAGKACSSGADNTCIGSKAGRSISTGDRNFAAGAGCGNALTTGSNNFLMGRLTGNVLGAGSNNIGIGSSVLQSNIDGVGNVAIGYQAMRDGNAGDFNVAIGQNAGQDTAGDYNIYLGYGAGGTHNGSNALYIANSNTATPLVYGEFDNKELGINIGAGCAATLHVDQPSTTGAKPALLLDQADIDLEFIKLVGSSEDGEADRSLVDVADMTTPGALTGWIQVYIEDIQATNPITDGVYYIPFYAAPSA